MWNIYKINIIRLKGGEKTEHLGPWAASKDIMVSSLGFLSPRLYLKKPQLGNVNGHRQENPQQKSVHFSQTTRNKTG